MATWNNSYNTYPLYARGYFYQTAWESALLRVSFNSRNGVFSIPGRHRTYTRFPVGRVGWCISISRTLRRTLFLTTARGDTFFETIITGFWLASVEFLYDNTQIFLCVIKLPDYTDNFDRPLRRLLVSTFLPVGEAFLLRKPCVLALLRFFGWYVLFMG